MPLQIVDITQTICQRGSLETMFAFGVQYALWAGISSSTPISPEGRTGVVALEDIPQSSFVLEFVGDLCQQTD